MRIFKVLRNSLYALVSFALIALLGIVVRKYFTVYLSVDLLGVEGLFSNIVAMLSLAEMGLTSVVSYGLYKELANHNESEINILMNVYRKIYSIVGLVTLLISVIIFFLLPYIIRESNIPWEYIQFVYIVQIMILLFSYFLAYKRVIYFADQKDYVVVKIDTICNSLKNVGQLIAIVIFKDYMLYCLTILISNLIANIIVSYRMHNDYPYIQNIKIDIKTLKEKNICSDIKNMMIHRFSLTIYGGTNAMFLSGFCSLSVAGMFANYQLIDSGIFSIMYKGLQGIVPSVGNLVNEEDKEKCIRIYMMLDFGYMLLGGYVCCLYIIAVQPLIRLYFGDAFLLPFPMLIFWGLYVFIVIQFENACNFRLTKGFYEYDRKYMLFCAMSKIFLGIFGTLYYGVIGLMVATLLSWMFIGYGRIKLVFNKIFDYYPIGPYLLKHLCWTLITVIEIAVIYLFLDKYSYPEQFWQLCVNCIIAFITMGIFQTIIFHRTYEFCLFYDYLQRTILVIRQKINGKADVL